MILSQLPVDQRPIFLSNQAGFLSNNHCRHGCRARAGGRAKLTNVMPEKKTVERARKDEQEGKAPSTQAGEFVREEIEHIRQGKHGVRSTKQAIAIGLSKARRSGVKLPPPKKGKTSEATRRKAERDLEKGETVQKSSPRRSSVRVPVSTCTTQTRETAIASSKTGNSRALAGLWDRCENRTEDRKIRAVIGQWDFLKRHVKHC